MHNSGQPVTRPFDWQVYATLRTQRCDTCCCRPTPANRDGFGAEHCEHCTCGDAVRKAAA